MRTYQVFHALAARFRRRNELSDPGGLLLIWEPDEVRDREDAIATTRDARFSHRSLITDHLTAIPVL